MPKKKSASSMPDLFGLMAPLTPLKHAATTTTTMAGTGKPIVKKYRRPYSAFDSDRPHATQKNSERKVIGDHHNPDGHSNGARTNSDQVMVSEFSNDQVESVASLSQKLKQTLERQFDHVRVAGEISGLKRAPSGHGYFNLKDSNEQEKSLINCFLLKHKFGYLPFLPADGMAVVATGRISTYGPRSNYQLLVDRLELAGTGNLLQIMEARKQKLLAEGLFDAARKKSLPPFPKVIGVITSPTGAVIRDIIHRVQARFPCHIIIYPVMVQGEGAPAQIATAIDNINHLGDYLGGELPAPDVIIIARGGGSLEDLWAFNEEIVVRACAASTIPTIAAVGHETDTTLIDFAADVRAPTPTAAAEMALPFPLAQTITALTHQQQRLQQASKKYCNSHEEKIIQLRHRLPSPQKMMVQKNYQLNQLWQRWQQGQKYFLRTHKNHLENLGRLLQSFGYKNTLKRGFALVQQGAGDSPNIIARAQQLQPNQPITISFYDGNIIVADHHASDKK